MEPMEPSDKALCMSEVFEGLPTVFLRSEALPADLILQKLVSICIKRDTAIQDLRNLPFFSVIKLHGLRRRRKQSIDVVAFPRR
jgi:hypothetical protein